PNSTNATNLTTNTTTNSLTFDNSTPEASAISIARLNEGKNGFDEFSEDMVANASLTPDGKYWIVKMCEAGYNNWVVKVDAKTLASTKSGGKDPINTWRSFDELKAIYIAEIQSTKSNGGAGRPTKLTMDGKEIWKVPIYYYHEYDPKQTEYVYVDATTGKSKNELYSDVFNEVSGTKGWLTLKEVDDIVNKIGDLRPMRGDLKLIPFKNALRDLYPD
ncbi:MAG TPA: hypothetical protein VHO92_04285, partial [Methanobacterium sp.]|nr:hypothetical protein [Methanobacterium sp.]